VHRLSKASYKYSQINEVQGLHFPVPSLNLNIRYNEIMYMKKPNCLELIVDQFQLIVVVVLITTFLLYIFFPSLIYVLSYKHSALEEEGTFMLSQKLNWFTSILVQDKPQKLPSYLPKSWRAKLYLKKIVQRFIS